LATSPLKLKTIIFIFQLNTCGYSPHVTCSLTRGWISRLQLLLGVASAVILGSEYRGTHDHNLLSQIRDSPNLQGKVPKEQDGPVIPPGTGLNLSSLSHVKTDDQSASLSWNKAPIWGLRPDFYYCQTVTGLLMCGALSDDRTGLSFTITAGPRQHSHSWVRVSWDSQSYFTVSDSRLPFRRLLRPEGLRRRYSTPPLHEIQPAAI
jgi:hypothetical protein